MSTNAQRVHFKLKRFTLVLLLVGGAFGSMYNFMDITDPRIPIESLNGSWFARSAIMLLIALAAGFLLHAVIRDFIAAHPEDRGKIY